MTATVPMGKLKALTLVVAAVTGLMGLRLALEMDAVPGTPELSGLLLFFLINVLAESKPLLLPGPKGTHVEITISGLSSYALIVLFPAFAAALAAACAVLVTEAFIKHKRALKSCFNTCQTFLSVAAAAAVYAFAMGHPITDQVAPEVVALPPAVMAYFLINTGLVSLALSLVQGTPFWRNWSSHYRWEVLYVVSSVPLALVLVSAYERLWIAGPILFLGPLFLLRESYAQYIRLKTNYTETVRTLVKVIETHDTYTAGHSLRVAEYAKALAQELKLSSKEVEKIEIAAYLHDLGKVDLAITNLVKKPERLTDEERMRVQLHPIVSAELAAQVTLFRGDIEGIIRYHHENHDGSGYPYGLEGDEIPLGARIIHVVDVFDAMISSRVYRKALSFAEVKAELRRSSGAHFDPRLVTVFLERCVRDDASVLAQVEPEYEEELADKLREAVAARRTARVRRGEPAYSAA